MGHQSCGAGGGCDPDQAGGQVAPQLLGLRVLQGEPDTLGSGSVPLVQHHHYSNIAKSLNCEGLQLTYVGVPARIAQ